MSSRWNIGKSAMSLDFGDALLPYTKVRIITDASGDETRCYEAGTDTGRTLEIYNPWGTQAMADNILERINGYVYQPFEARGAFLPDEAELGDGVWVGDTYGPLVAQDIDFNHLGTSDISAPGGDDTDNEFDIEYLSPEVRAILRQESRITSLIVEQGHIRSQISDAVAELGSSIDQRLDSITLSVSSRNGSTTFTLKDGETTLDTKTLNLSVDAVNVSGLLTARQIDATNLHVSAANVDGDLRAGALYGGTVGLYDTAYADGEWTDTIRGSFDLTGTETGVGVAVNSRTGLKLNAITNIFLKAGSGGAMTLRDHMLYFAQTGICLSSYSFGSDPPSGTGQYGEVYFQLVN